MVWPVFSHQPPATGAFLQGEAQTPQGLAHPAGVLGLQAAPEDARTRGDGREQQGPVGDGLGAWHPLGMQGFAGTEPVVLRQ